MLVHQLKHVLTLYVSVSFTDPFTNGALVAPQSDALQPGLHYDFSQHGRENEMGFHIFQKDGFAEVHAVLFKFCFQERKFLSSFLLVRQGRPNQ